MKKSTPWWMEKRIERPSEEYRRRVKAHWDAIAKPLDGMGIFEELIAQIGAIQGSDWPKLSGRSVLVFCADNGIVAEGVSQSGQEVTKAVAESLARGGSSVCRMAKNIGAAVIPIDIGIACRAEELPREVLGHKVRQGTADFLKEPAMTREELLEAIEVGIHCVKERKQAGDAVLALGEMGIGNTTTSAAVAAAMLGCSVEHVTGRGAGLSDDGMKRKQEVIKEALQKYGWSSENLEDGRMKTYDSTLRILQCVGGLDIAGLVGACIGGALYHVPIVLDGVISCVAALAAERIQPGVKEYLIPSHLSREPAAELVYCELGIRPIIDASMALGEGTGAAMMLGMLDMAMTVYEESSDFKTIAVEQYTRFENESMR